jgi:hypothetical protein
MLPILSVSSRFCFGILRFQGHGLIIGVLSHDRGAGHGADLLGTLMPALQNALLIALAYEQAQVF